MECYTSGPDGNSLYMCELMMPELINNKCTGIKHSSVYVNYDVTLIKCLKLTSCSLFGQQ